MTVLKKEILRKRVSYPGDNHRQSQAIKTVEFTRDFDCNNMITTQERKNINSKKGAKTMMMNKMMKENMVMMMCCLCCMKKKTYME